MAIESFAPIGGVFVSAGPTSQAIAVPGAFPAIVIVTNEGMNLVYIALGADDTVVADRTGYPVLPGSFVAVTLGANTHVAVLGLTQNIPVNLTFGS